MSKSDPVIKELEKTYDTNLLDIKSQEDKEEYGFLLYTPYTKEEMELYKPQKIN